MQAVIPTATAAPTPIAAVIHIIPQIPYYALYPPFVDKRSNSSIFKKQEFNSI